MGGRNARALMVFCWRVAVAVSFDVRESSMTPFCLATTTKTTHDIFHDNVTCLRGASKESHDYISIYNETTWIKDSDIDIVIC